MDMAGLKEFLELRHRLLTALEKEEKRCGEPGKGYEGEMGFQFFYPGIYDEKTKMLEPDMVTICAHFYLIGPKRHYSWQGKTLLEAVKKAAKDIDGWIKEAGVWTA